MNRLITGTLLVALLAGPLWAATATEPKQAAAPQADPSAALARPTAGLAEFQEMGFGLFVHWSPSVYQGSEGDNLSTPRNKINPDRFDAEQIVRAARSCGAGYVVFVAKHVGGYCAWQTETTDYSLKTSPWKHGKGDMVGELAAACRKAGLKFGVYLCPRDDYHHIGNGGRASSSDKQQEAESLYRRQLTELLTHYGPLFEVWFDGGNKIPVNDLIDKYAPNLVTFQGRRRGSSRWVGTEHGHAPYPCWNTVTWKEGDMPHWGGGTRDGNLWAPAECDVSILRPRWFWYQGCDSAVLSLDQLLEIYYLSLGRSANLLLNITPDDHGEIPESEMQRLAELGGEIKARFGSPLAVTRGAMKEATGSLTLTFSGETTVDHVRLREDIRGGERARQFTVRGKRIDGAWRTLIAGSQIGARQIIPFDPATVTELKLEITDAVAPVAISEFAAFHVGRAVPLLAYRGAGPRRPLATSTPNVKRSPDGIFAIDCPTPDWEIRYTLDGAEPTAASTLYHEPQSLPRGGIVKTRYFFRNGADKSRGPVSTSYFGLPGNRIKVLHASSAEKDSPAAAAFDGDPATFWHTAWRKLALPPHEIVIELDQDYPIGGLSFLRRENTRNGYPKGTQVWIGKSRDMLAGRPSFAGDFQGFTRDPRDWGILRFDKPATGRFLRIVFPDLPHGDKCLMAAEIGVMIGKF